MSLQPPVNAYTFFAQSFDNIALQRHFTENSYPSEKPQFLFIFPSLVTYLLHLSSPPFHFHSKYKLHMGGN